MTKGSTWWLIETDSLATTLMEWAIVLLVMIGINWWMGPLKIYEPKNRYARLILGVIFKFTPRKRYHSSEESSTTPDAVRVQIVAICIVVMEVWSHDVLLV